MRNYMAKLAIPDSLKNLSTGKLAEEMFSIWFNNNYQGEKLFKQLADRDYEKIDFCDEKGYTYQVKGTRAKTYTFNCPETAITSHLRASFYVLIQLKEDIAYIETICDMEYIIDNVKPSFKEINRQCYVPAKDLQQYELIF